MKLRQEPIISDNLEIDDLFQFICSKLTDREGKILRLRFNGYTLKEIGIIYNINRERVRQIIITAIRKTRRNLFMELRFLQ